MAICGAEEYPDPRFTIAIPVIVTVVAGATGTQSISTQITFPLAWTPFGSSGRSKSTVGKE
jgi:hypothetical protein